MKTLVTKRQNELLSIIYRYVMDAGYPPTVAEMREKLAVASNQSVLDLLGKLEAQKLIKKASSAARSIAILPLGYEILGQPPLVGFLGSTSAGAPIEAVEISGEWQAVPGDVAKFKDEVFLLKVSGDSMINAGIEDGDVVLVKAHKEFVSGDVVLAQIGDESTVKRFVSDDTPPYVYLKPENPNYDTIPFTEQTRLIGKVVSVVKRGYWKQVK